LFACFFFLYFYLVLFQKDQRKQRQTPTHTDENRVDIGKQKPRGYK
jgi:hypothetical protein